MPFNPKDFLALGKSFQKPDLSEAQYRTAISRTLYGVFLWAREELETRGAKKKATSWESKPFEHSSVRACFDKGKFRHDKVKSRLDALYELRYKSDYSLEESVSLDDLLHALDHAQYIGNAFEKSLFSGPAKKP